MTEKPTVEQPIEGLDIRQYFSLLLYRSWLIILVALICGIISYLVSIKLPPIYQSATSILVNEAPANKGADYSSVMMSKQLTSTYAQMMTNDVVLGQVAAQVGISNPIEDIRDWIKVTTVRDTQLIQLTVETTDPNFSARIANAIVEAFSTQIQEIQTQRFAQSKTTLETQLADTEKQISTYTAQVDLASSSDEKERLEAKVAQYRTIYANLLTSYEQLRLSEAQAVSSVVQVEPAVANPIPVKPNIILNTLLAAFIGILLTSGILVARETINDTIKTPEDITRRFNLPILGVINHQPPKSNILVTIKEPRSLIAETYRTLRTNVSYASIDKPIRTLLITSPEPGDGKTTTICNLGVVLAQNGKKVVIADCDLRRPRVHTYFGLPNRQGMSTLFAHNDIVPGVLKSTPVEGLTVITSGSLPPNPSELMGSQKIKTIFSTLLETADIILIDTPPTLTVTDAATLAPSLDGMILVVRPGITRTNALKQTLEQLRQVNARVLGIVLNDVPTKGNPYGYHYNYYHNYSAYKDYYEEKVVEKKGK
ncbi:polysaccharide biosynthesis tyrosine autokinase [Leptolinea tardivitalis]|uniref:polysaccharide biosynthesis tyrosine autokinase n=1 Tax=Leptolinea tardivitalis TaxID=229920 RepID=UPI00078601ED|nr:polysaccharide biosynthesis tyrosine autokinase [Leptolinea tardivitalis]GAP20734.1 capsular exopolysaccharide family [Leptolinea tardivitalis]